MAPEVFMSTTSSVTSSSNASYATTLAETSQLRRSLYNLGSAIQSGNLGSASSILTAIIKAHPEYATTSSSNTSSTSTGSSINSDFTAVAAALDASDADAAKTAWTRLKSDLAEAGVTDITNGKADTAKLLAETKTSVDQAIISNMFDVGSSGDSSAATLIGASSSSSSDSDDAVSAAISNWLTYKATGKTSSTTSDTTLDTSA